MRIDHWQFGAASVTPSRLDQAKDLGTPFQGMVSNAVSRRIAGSRTGFLIFIIVGMLMLFFASWGKKLALMGGIVLLVLAYSGRSGAFSFGAPLILFERIDAIDSTEDTRFPLWKGAYKAVLSSNFAGLGIGQFKTRLEGGS